MKEVLEKYFYDLKRGVAAVREYPSAEIILLHHNDTDGLTSGAILCNAFDRKGYGIKRYSLEKPYPKVLKKIFSENSGKIIVFADFAGKIAPMIGELNKDRNLVVILDHHKAEKSESKSVINLDPDLYGLKGDRDISASVVCWYFACMISDENLDMAHIAALGGIADFYYLDNLVHGENRKTLEKACEQGTMRTEGTGTEEKFFIRLGKKEFDVVELYNMLDIIGGAGFYGGGPELGIKLLLEGYDEADEEKIEQLSRLKDEKFSAELERIKNGEYQETEHIVWFDVKDRFSPMGVKMIGLFLEELADSGLVDRNRYLAGYQQIPDEIPGMGPVKMGETKISMRTSAEVTKRIFEEELPGLNAFLPEATLNLGGFADACHRVAAATTIKQGMEKELIEESERVLKKLMNK